MATAKSRGFVGRQPTFPRLRDEPTDPALAGWYKADGTGELAQHSVPSEAT